MTEIRPPKMTLKPTLETRFFIDPVWWKQSDQDLNSAVAQIALEYDVVLPEQGDQDIDWVDPRNGVVTAVNQAYYVFLRDVCSKDDYITDRTPMIDAIFRALLATARRPISVEQIADLAKRPASGVLQLLSGRTVYKGIRRYIIHDEA